MYGNVWWLCIIHENGIVNTLHSFTEARQSVVHRISEYPEINFEGRNNLKIKMSISKYPIVAQDIVTVQNKHIGETNQILAPTQARVKNKQMLNTTPY